MIQRFTNRAPGRARSTGEINVQPGAEKWDATIWIEIRTYTTDLRLPCCQGGVVGDQSLLFETVTNCPDSFNGDIKAELHIDLTMYIAQNVTFENLSITSDSLSVRFHPGLNYEVSNTTTISTQGNGSISMPSPTEDAPGTTIYSRETIIDLSSGSVTGTYALYDLLSIHTTSGSIAIALTLHNASASAPKPAALEVGTSSGSIRAHTSSLHAHTTVPDRNYQTAIRSNSGSVDISLVHGTGTFLRSSSGSLVASLYPHGPNTTRSDIETHTSSGRTKIIVHPALVNAPDPLRKLYGKYNYHSGSFQLAYPPSWEGTLEGVVSSGSIDINWEGMQIVEDRKGWAGRKVKAVKGDGEGVLRFHGNSGSANLRGDGGCFAKTSKAADEVCWGHICRDW